jgi:TP901 family phage tail tape measure protein
MPSANGIRAGAAFIELYTKDSRLVKGLDAAALKLKAFGATIKDMGTKIAGIGLSLTLPFVGAAKSFADMGSNLADMSQRTGVSVEALSGLGFAAELSGADMETLETGIRKMQQRIVDAKGGSKEAQQALARLNLTVDDLAKLTPDEQFKLFADRLSKIRNPTVRAALALDIFGKSGTKLLPVMANGAQGIEELEERARKLGLTMSTEDAEAADEFGDTLDTLWKVLKKSVFAIGAALAPALTELVEGIIAAVKMTTDWIKKNKDLVVTVFKIAAAIAAGGLALIAIGGIVSTVGAALGSVVTIFSAVGTAIGVIGSILGALLSPIGLVIAGVTALAAFLLHASGVGGAALAWLGEQFNALKDTALAAWQGIADALAAGDLGLAARIVWLTLKLEWKKGLLWLEEKWLDFKNFFVDVFFRAVFGLARLLNDAWAGIQVAWLESLAFLSDAWTGFISFLQKGWNRFGGFFRKVWARVKSVFSGKDAEAEIARINDEVAQQDKEITAKRDMAVREREQERQRRRNEIERDRAGIEGELNRMQDQERAEREARKQAELQETEDDLAQARREWEQALDEAAKKRAEREAERDLPRLRRAKEIEGLDELIDTTQKKIDVQGTFNPLAIRGLGSDSLAERTAKATEQVAANTKKLVQEAQHGGLVFA